MDAVTEWAVGPGHYTTYDGKPAESVSRGRGRGRSRSRGHGRRGGRNGRGRGRGGTNNTRAVGPDSTGQSNQDSAAPKRTTTRPKQEKNRQNTKNKSQDNHSDSSKSILKDLINEANPTPAKADVPDTSLSSQQLEAQMVPGKDLFITLPGELRTKIYEYVFGQYRVEIIKRKRTGSTNQRQRHSYRLYHKNLPLPCPDDCDHVCGWSRSPPMALSLTCPQIYRETLLYVYSNTYFVFCSTKVINMFLNRVNEHALSTIRHIELTHVMYHEPALTEHRKYKLISDISWYSTCARMSRAFSSLKSLLLDLTIGDWPIQLKTTEQWALPFQFFKNLDDVKVNLATVRFKEEKRRKTARQLEKEMMDETAWQIKDDGRIARNLLQSMQDRESLQFLDVMHWDTSDHFF